MLYEVRIFDRSGRMKKIVSSQKLARIYWEKFAREESSRSLLEFGGPKVPLKIKKALDLEFPDFKDCYAIKDS